jgi:hypothetical protein
MGDARTSGVDALFHTLTSHIRPHHSDYFVKWLDFLALEETSLDPSRVEIWAMTSQERESLGRYYYSYRDRLVIISIIGVNILFTDVYRECS